MISRIALTFLLVLFVNPISFSHTPTFQKRDHLTQQEVDLVKEAQVLDKRIEVFVKAAERWGELPTGSRAELVADIARILDEAITNIDDVSARDERNPLIGKSLRKLAQSVNSIMAQLKPLSADAKSDAEVASFEMLNEDAHSILEAANRLPPEV